MMAPRSLVLYGGTFDPVHHGHLLGARDVLEQLELDALVFIPAARSPHKLDREAAPAEHRLAMLRAAIAGEPRFSVSSIEVDRASPSYAITTVRELQAVYPSTRLHFLIGADQLPKLPTWAQFDELVRLVDFIVLDREPLSLDADVDREIRRTGATLLRLPRPRRIDVSSSEVRARLHAGLPIGYLVPSAVVDYIARASLYRTT